MDFTDTLMITIIDKLIIGAFLVWLAFYLNARLEKFKKDQDREQAFLLQVSVSRLNAYLKLWSLTEKVSPSSKEEIRKEIKENLSNRLRSWYYEDGNGVYLTLIAADLFLKAKETLNVDTDKQTEQIKEAFSKLRTQMKIDIGAYSDEQSRTQIGK
jgi:hypothetical protein